MYLCDKCNAIIHDAAMDNHPATCPCYCQYCHIVTEREAIRSGHKEKCHKFPQKCSKCGLDEIPRDNMDEHKKMCPFEMIQCECGAIVPRNNIDEHKKQKMTKHFLLQLLQKSNNTFHRLHDIKHSNAVYSLVLHLKTVLCIALAVVILLRYTVINHNLDPRDIQDHITKLHENFNSDILHQIAKLQEKINSNYQHKIVKSNTDIQDYLAKICNSNIHKHIAELHQKISDMQDHIMNNSDYMANLHEKVNVVLPEAPNKIATCDNSKQNDLKQHIEKLETINDGLTQELNASQSLVKELENRLESERKQESEELKASRSLVKELENRLESERKQESEELKASRSLVKELENWLESERKVRKQESEELKDCRHRMTGASEISKLIVFVFILVLIGLCCCANR